MGKRREQRTQIRDLQAMELRKAGASYDQIARQMGYAQKSGAHHAVMRALKAALQARDESAAEMREMEAQRINAYLLGIYQKATHGDPRAIEVALKLSERMAALFGLDAPVRRELSGPDGGPIEVDNRVIVSEEERDQRILAIVEQARERSDRVALSSGPDVAPPNGATNGRVAH
jgi:hypothetical protein